MGLLKKLLNPLKATKASIQAGNKIARKTTSLAVKGAVATTKPMLNVAKKTINTKNPLMPVLNPLAKKKKI